MEIILTQLAKHLTTPELNFIPKQGTTLSAGYDVRACIASAITLNPGECRLIPLGFKIHIGSDLPFSPSDEEVTICGLILPRSGLGSMAGIVLGNNVGLIDEDYQCEWMCAVLNRNFEQEVVITSGMKIAQVIFTPTYLPQFKTVDDFEVKTSRNGGFGSTGN